MHIFPWSELVWSGIGEELAGQTLHGKEPHRQIKRGWFFFFAHPEEHCNGRHILRDCVAEKGMLPYVGCVGVGKAKPDTLYRR